MLGFITETDLRQADEVFPGIEQFFDALAEKPRTFLELVSQFEHWTGRCTRHVVASDLTECQRRGRAAGSIAVSGPRT